MKKLKYWIIVSPSHQDKMNDAANALPTLHQAAMLGAIDCMKELLQTGVDINAHDDAGKTPLECAISYRQLEATQFLLYAHSENTAQYLYGQIIIQSLSKLQSQTELSNQEATDVIDKIISLIDYSQKQGLEEQTIVRNVIQSTVKLILRQVKDIHAIVNEDGITFLHLAAVIGDIKLIQGLLNKGMEAKCHDIGGKTPLHYAIQNDQLKAVELLLQVPLQANLTHHEAIDLMNAIIVLVKEIQQQDIEYSWVCEIIRLVGTFILKQIEDIHAIINEDGITFLHLAALIGDMELMQSLLDKGMKVNDYHAFQGETPLYYAIQYGQLEAVKLLLPQTFPFTLREGESRELQEVKSI